MLFKIEFKGTKASIWNKNLFRNSDDFDVFVYIEKEGKRISKDKLDLVIAPGKKKLVECKEFMQKAKEPGEYVLTISFQEKKATRYAKAHHEVAYGQNVFRVNEKKTAKKGKNKSPKLVNSTFMIGVHGDDFEVLFDKVTGGLVSYSMNGKQCLAGMVKPNFWRAPTNNDEGANLPAYLGQWKIASLYLNNKEDNLAPILPTIKEGKESITISFTYQIPTNPNTTCVVQYEVFGCGRVNVEARLNDAKDLPPVPEFSMLFTLPKEFENLCWYGLGPEETYDDRKAAGKLSVYSGKVKDQLADYLVPQESGNKCDVRYAEVTNSSGQGLRFAMQDKLLEFSALPYTPHQLEEAKYAYELPKVYKTIVRVMHAQMGVGGDNSWGAIPHPEYWIKKKNLVLRFSFWGI